MQPNRIEPRLPPKAFKTYAIATPAEDAYRPASCQEVECPNYTNGWVINIDKNSELKERQAHLIKESKKKFTVMDGFRSDQTGQLIEDSEFVAVMFEPGQSCFEYHQVRTAKPEVYTVRDGDYRDLGNTYIHKRPEDWVDDFQNNQQKLIERQERG